MYMYIQVTWHCNQVTRSTASSKLFQLTDLSLSTCRGSWVCWGVVPFPSWWPAQTANHLYQKASHSLQNVDISTVTILTWKHNSYSIISQYDKASIAGNFGKILQWNLAKQLTNINIMHVRLWCQAFRSPNLNFTNINWKWFHQINARQNYPCTTYMYTYDYHYGIKWQTHRQNTSYRIIEIDRETSCEC